jgi:hypothetical protein
LTTGTNGISAASGPEVTLSVGVGLGVIDGSRVGEEVGGSVGALVAGATVVVGGCVSVGAWLGGGVLVPQAAARQATSSGMVSRRLFERAMCAPLANG